MRYLLRVEAVNLGSFVYDTQNLSTIRGGGLLLLRAPEMIGKAFDVLQPIACGASTGLFGLEVDESAAENVRGKVASFLQTDEHLRHATFVVDVQPTSGDFVRDLEAVTARNRWRQWAQLTQTVPEPPRGENPTCEIDLVRPSAGDQLEVKGKKRSVSESVRMRMEFGRDQKRKFYGQETGLKNVSDFVQDLDKLSADENRGNLHHKMAVIYIDGNSFGEIRTRLCREAESLRRFSNKIQNYQRQALKTLLTGIENDDDGYRNGLQIRLETLLWGGDELIWVVPAWRGWRALNHFFTSVAEARFEAEPRGVPLTYAGGLVFCHHNAPIHRIVRLAKSLAESAKRRNRDEAASADDGTVPRDEASRLEVLSKFRNRFEYVVLESFDHVGLNLSAYKTRRYRGAAAHSATHDVSQSWDSTLEGADMADIEANVRKLKWELPQGQVIELAHSSVNELRAGTTMEELQERLEKTQDIQINFELDKLEAKLGKPPKFWFHLAELWDYIVED